MKTLVSSIPVRVDGQLMTALIEQSPCGYFALLLDPGTVGEGRYVLSTHHSAKDARETLPTYPWLEIVKA